MERMRRQESWGYFEHTLTTAIVAEKGKLACIDTATGLITKGVVSTTLRPIGYFDNSLAITGDGTAKVRVQLFDEIKLHLWANDGTNPVLATDIGKICYVKDDATVTILATGASAAGRVWGVTLEGVLVEMLGFATAIS